MRRSPHQDESRPPQEVMECCCLDCYQHLEWASVMGGPKVPIVPTLSYWDNDIDVVRGEEHLRFVLLREDGRSKKTTATCCFSNTHGRSPWVQCCYVHAF